MPAHHAGGVLGDDLPGVEPSGPIRDKGVRLGLHVHMGEEQLGTPRQGFGIKRGAAGEEKGLGRFDERGLLPILGDDHARRGEAGATQHDGRATGKRTADGLIRLASHEQHLTHGSRLEECEVLRDAPRELVVQADAAIARDGRDGDERTTEIHGVRWRPAP